MTPCICRDYEYTGMCQHTRASTVAGVKEAILINPRKFGKQTIAMREFFEHGKAGKAVVFATPQGNFLSPKAVENLEAAVRADEREKMLRLVDEHDPNKERRKTSPSYWGNTLRAAIRAIAPSNYAHLSHSHCWDQKQPPACGIPLKKHTQCCLCDLPLPGKGK